MPKDMPIERLGSGGDHPPPPPPPPPPRFGYKWGQLSVAKRIISQFYSDQPGNQIMNCKITIFMSVTSVQFASFSDVVLSVGMAMGQFPE